MGPFDPEETADMELAPRGWARRHDVRLRRLRYVLRQRFTSEPVLLGLQHAIVNSEHTIASTVDPSKQLSVPESRLYLHIHLSADWSPPMSARVSGKYGPLTIGPPMCECLRSLRADAREEALGGMKCRHMR